MEIQPATLDQISIGRDGKKVLIFSDAGMIAKDLKAIDPNLELHANEDGDYFEIRCKHPGNGKSYLVTTAKELDARIVERIREIREPTYNYADELEKEEARRKADLEYDRKQKLGEAGERLAHAMRKDKNIKKNF